MDKLAFIKSLFNVLNILLFNKLAEKSPNRALAIEI